MKNVKYRLIIVIFVAVVAGGVGLKYAYDRLFIASPIEREAGVIPGVESIEMTEGSDGRRYVVAHLGSDAIIEDVYPKLHRMTESVLQTGDDTLRIVDGRNDVLQRAYAHIHYALYEGASTGRFTTMADTVHEQLNSFNLADQRVTVTETHIFVTLVTNDAYLYEVIRRLDGRRENDW